MLAPTQRFVARVPGQPFPLLVLCTCWPIISGSLRPPARVSWVSYGCALVTRTELRPETDSCAVCNVTVYSTIISRCEKPWIRVLQVGATQQPSNQQCAIVYVFYDRVCSLPKERGVQGPQCTRRFRVYVLTAFATCVEGDDFDRRFVYPHGLLYCLNMLRAALMIHEHSYGGVEEELGRHRAF
jgi:hypothetical protein